MEKENNGDEITIDDYLEMIHHNATSVISFIEGLIAGAVLQGRDKEDIYKIERLYATASNIRSYCNAITNLLEKMEKK